VWGIGHEEPVVDSVALEHDKQQACEVGKINEQLRKEVARKKREKEIEEYHYYLEVIKKHMAEMLRRRRALQVRRRYHHIPTLLLCYCWMYA
jgi:hypothetical protein